ncbi:MAG TPA: hypothetical protein VKY73_14885 [Polyangiaceae bacterium]|nr:hypothetical protein [Polyangiaceae bacterium]
MTANDDSDSLAKRAFVLTIVGTLIYALCVYAFVLRGNSSTASPPNTEQAP